MEIRIPYGLKNNRLVHISEVESGLKCGCICPSCKCNLIAKKGDELTHHFAHSNNSQCAWAYETTLHLMAKEILNDSKTMVVPSVTIGNGKILVSDSKRILFDEVVLEKRIGRIIPDVVMYKNGVALLVEITVTHGIDKTKIKKIKDLNISCIEISLKGENEAISKDELKKVFETDNQVKKWVYNQYGDRCNNILLSRCEKKRIYNKGVKSYIRNCILYNQSPSVSYIFKCKDCKYNFGTDLTRENVKYLDLEINTYCGYKNNLTSFENLYTCY